MCGSPSTSWDGSAQEEFADLYTWARWDGRQWLPADGPDPFASTVEHVLDGYGVAWALSQDAGSGSQIARYTDGQMSVISEERSLRSLTTAPGAGACALSYPTRDDIQATEIVCYDAYGERQRIDVAGLGISDFSIAPDGALWVSGPQVARLGKIRGPVAMTGYPMQGHLGSKARTALVLVAAVVCLGACGSTLDPIRGRRIGFPERHAVQRVPLRAACISERRGRCRPQRLRPGVRHDQAGR